MEVYTTAHPDGSGDHCRVADGTGVGGVLLEGGEHFALGSDQSHVTWAVLQR